MSDKPTIKDLLRAHQKIKEEMPEMDIGPIKDLFSKDENIPHIDDSQVGWVRLIHALRNKYGPNYRSIPEVSRALHHYEKEVKFMKLYKKVIGARHGR